MFSQETDFNYLVSTNDLMQLCSRALSLYDKRLIDHGERVAFLACEINKKMKLDIDIKTLILLSVFHDIGAYKTEEIDRMTQFETTDVHEHAAYGYLFFKYCSPFSDYSKVILYHHSTYDNIRKLGTSLCDYTVLIQLADRIDIARINNVSIERILNWLNNSDIEAKYTSPIIETLETTDIYNELPNYDVKSYLYSILGKYTQTYSDVMQFIKLLVYSVDFKSKFTVEHTINTIIISSFIATSLNLSKQQKDIAYMSALLHDIGKIAIPVDILEKPGKLDDEQMTIMRSHVVQTEKVLTGIVPDEILHAATRHHERLDGKGYPRGLDSKELTLLDRIVAVADIMSALLGKRSYKKEFSINDTLDILTDMASKGYIDGEIVALVCDKTSQLLEIVDGWDKKMQKTYSDMMEEYIVYFNN